MELQQETKTQVKKTLNNNHKAGRAELTFLNMWEKLGTPFNKHYEIKDVDFWNKFWDDSTFSAQDVYIALRNIAYACNGNGMYTTLESRYISPDPCQFIKGGMFQRALNDTGIKDNYDYDHPDWENPQSEYYDKNLPRY